MMLCARVHLVPVWSGHAVPVRSMATLKDVRNRLKSVKSIKKITASMKMVAAAKLRVAQTILETSSRPFAADVQKVLGNVYSEIPIEGKSNVLVAITSDRGLCGAVNSAIIKETRRRLRAAPDISTVILVGDKGKAGLQREWGRLFISSIKELVKRPPAQFIDIMLITNELVRAKYDILTLLYNKFVSMMSTLPTAYVIGTRENLFEKIDQAKWEMDDLNQEVLDNLYEYHMATTLFGAVAEQSASELAARMTAMDSATKNAGIMIDSLMLQYNRRRQAGITTELCEIIGGAEALKG